MFLLLHLSFDERTCLSVEVRVSQGNVENFKHLTAKKKQQSGCLEIYFIEILYCIHLRQNKNLINNILSYTEIYFSKYRLAQTQILLMRVFRYQNPNEICLLKKVYNQIIIFVCY